MDKQSILTYSGRQITLQLCQKWINIFLFIFSLINLPFTYDFAVFFISFVRSLSNCKDTSVVICFVNMQRNKHKCKEHMNSYDTIYLRTIWLTETGSILCAPESCQHSLSVARKLGIWDKNCLLTGDTVSVFSRTPTLWIFFTPSLLYSPGKKAKGTCFVMWERKDLPMRHLVFE